MGLDLYAGSLTRYLLGDWTNEVQAWAEREGVAYQQIRPGGALAAMNPWRITQWLHRRRLARPVAEWRTQAEERIGFTLDLDETPASPYLARGFQWYALQATQLWAAYVMRGGKPPWPMPEEIADDEVFRSETGDPGGRAAVLFQSEMWLPAPLQAPVKLPWVGSERQVSAHSSIALEELLTDVLRAFPSSRKKDEQLTNFHDAVEKFREITAFSIKHRVPLLLDW